MKIREESEWCLSPIPFYTVAAMVILEVLPWRSLLDGAGFCRPEEVAVGAPGKWVVGTQHPTRQGLLREEAGLPKAAANQANDNSYSQFLSNPPVAEHD